MKGLDLSINFIILIALALIVLIAAYSLFFGAWQAQKSGFDIEAAKSAGCRALRAKGCYDYVNEEPTDTDKIIISGFDVNGDSEPGNEFDTLTLFCSKYMGVLSKEDCRKIVCDCEV